jgi:dienelactone hydrolase
MAPGFRLVTPSGKGPFPTVLLIPGCGGIRRPDGPNPIMDEYAKSATEAGWAAAILDSFEPRGWDVTWARTRVCAGARLQGLIRSADVLAGLDLMAAEPRVDHRHVRIAGWSHGGWSIGDLMTLGGPEDFHRTMEGVEAIYLTYRLCGRPARAPRREWTWTGDVTLLLAADDVVQPPAGCDPLVARAKAGGSTVQVTVIPGVTHAFDERQHMPNSRSRFDPAATERAHRAFIAWLETPVARPARVRD